MINDRELALYSQRPFYYAVSESYSTYAQGLSELAQLCISQDSPQPQFTKYGLSFVRPFTFEETVRALVEDFHSKNPKDRLALFSQQLSTCTGIICDEQKYKVIPFCEPLAEIAEGTDSIELVYENVVGIEGGCAGWYGVQLSRHQFVDHEGWKLLIEDQSLLMEYASIIYEFGQTKRGMYFELPVDEELHVLSVDSLVKKGGAYGGGELNDPCRFLYRKVSDD